MSFIDLTDAIDHLIIMHREAHFGGLFEEMILYYQNEDHIGIHPDIELERIYELHYYEQKTETNLYDFLLTEEEKEKIAAAKKSYIDLKKIYDVDNERVPYPRLIADLILSEEEEPKELLDKIIASQHILLPHLLRILQWDEAYDPLFPGYGYAPSFALQALCRIKNKESIIPLFETLKRDPFFGEEKVLQALCFQGVDAKNFLLKRMNSLPLTADNTYAAYALSCFSPDQDIAYSALALLKNPQVWKMGLFASYLLALCEEKREELSHVLQNPLLPQNLKKEIEQSIKK